MLYRSSIDSMSVTKLSSPSRTLATCNKIKKKKSFNRSENIWLYDKISESSRERNGEGRAAGPPFFLPYDFFIPFVYNNNSSRSRDIIHTVRLAYRIIVSSRCSARDAVYMCVCVYAYTCIYYARGGGQNRFV